MPRSILSSFRKEIEASFSSEVNLCFLTLTHNKLSNPIRVVWDNKDYIYGGNRFTGFPFDIEIMSDDESTPKAQLTIQNVDSRIGQTIRALTSPVRVKMELLSTLDFNITVDPRVELSGGSPPSNIVYSFSRAFMINTKVDFMLVTADLVSWDYLQRVWPGKRATQALCPGLFR